MKVSREFIEKLYKVAQSVSVIKRSSIDKMPGYHRGVFVTKREDKVEFIYTDGHIAKKVSLDTANQEDLNLVDQINATHLNNGYVVNETVIVIDKNTVSHLKYALTLDEFDAEVKDKKLILCGKGIELACASMPNVNALYPKASDLDDKFLGSIIFDFDLLERIMRSSNPEDRRLTFYLPKNNKEPIYVENESWKHLMMPCKGNK